MSIKRQVLRAEVQEMILDRLTQGTWRPGSRLSIDGLARDLEVSPTPVREALVALERSGLIRYQALKGYVVSEPLTPEQIGELIDARIVIELAALTRAFGRWEELIADMGRIHERHRDLAQQIAASADPPFELVHQYFLADNEFHAAIFEQAGNPFLSSMRESLMAHAHRMRQTWSEGVEQIDSAEAIAEHGEILTRIQERNHDGALQALRGHIEAVGERSGGIRIPDGA